MARTVLIDSGPIVAALRRRDQHHDWARAQFEATTEPFLTCEGVISESHQDTPMSFADACLVRMAELRDEAIILTTDTDFQIYRKKGRQVIPLLVPER